MDLEINNNMNPKEDIQLSEIFLEEVVANEVIIRELNLKILELLDGQEQEYMYIPRFNESKIKDLETTILNLIHSKTSILDSDLTIGIHQILQTYLGKPIHIFKDSLINQLSEILYDEMVFKKMIDVVESGYANQLLSAYIFKYHFSCVYFSNPNIYSTPKPKNSRIRKFKNRKEKSFTTINSRNTKFFLNCGYLLFWKFNL